MSIMLPRPHVDSLYNVLRVLSCKTMFAIALSFLAVLGHLSQAVAAQKTSEAQKKGTGEQAHRRDHSTNAEKRSSLQSKNQVRIVKKMILVHGRRKFVYQRVAFHPTPLVPTAGDLAGLQFTPDPLMLSSNVAFVLDASNDEVLFEKNSNIALPIASLTKLMSGLVVVESSQNMAEMLVVTDEDIDRTRNSRSRLSVGAQLTRADMLRIALMSSENRAASALGRSYPGGLPAFVAAMNDKAQSLDMHDTHYADPTGLSSGNVASARDLAKLVVAASRHPVLAEYSTHGRYAVDTGQRVLQYVNSNRLIGKADWDIGLQKTGYISEAGRCLVMQVAIRGHAIVMVFLDSKRRHARFEDADRLRLWVLEKIAPASSQLSSAEQTPP